MLTEDLREVLHERAADVDADAMSLLADLEVRLSRRRLGRPLVAALVAAAVVAASVVVSIRLAGSAAHDVSVADSNGVPCATPAVTPVHYIDWACAPGPVDAYFRDVFDHPSQVMSDIATFDRDARVLAYGDMPASRPGGRFVVAELWNPDTLKTRLVVVFTQPAGVLPPSTQEHLARYGVGPNDPVGSAGIEDPTPPPVGALMVVSTPHPSTHFAASCSAQLAQVPGPRHAYLAACSNIVIARSDVAELRLLHNGVVIGQPVPVRNRATGLPSPRANRPGWTIEALNADGDIVGAVPWRAVV
ncbi:MAG TPA: hypothetical protein VHC43_06505 [Mycobacteriales bacterium]|nr:hypothetical protein [Mycobacteriales bacterium]